MSKRITITLTDEEYAMLEQKAAQERRTPREMAAYLVTKSQPWIFTPDWTYRPNDIVVVPPLTTTDRWITRTTVSTGCPACLAPNTAGITHTCNQWQTICTASQASVVN